MLELRLTGNTFSIRGELKEQGFKWNSDKRVWYKTFDDDEDEHVYQLANAYEDNGVYGDVHHKDTIANNERRYYVKGSWLFNLESMHDKIWCLSYDIDEHRIELPFMVAGKVINGTGDLWELMDEVDELSFKARGKVTGTEYGRIKEIVAWRINARYTTCLDAGMDEADAGRCFEDM